MANPTPSPTGNSSPVQNYKPSSTVWTDFISELTTLSLYESLSTSRPAPATLPVLDLRGALLKQSVFRSWSEASTQPGRKFRKLKFSGAYIDYSHIPTSGS